MFLCRLSKYSDWAPLALRVALGLVLAVHGYDKFFGSGISGVSGYFSSVGLPAPLALAWVSAIIEFFGGILLLVGLFARYAAVAVGIEFAVVLLLKIFQWKIPLVDFQTGVGGFQLDFLIFAAAAAVFLLGNGKKLALEQMLFKKEL